MKRFVIYVFSLLTFLVFCSKSCDAPGDQQNGSEEAELAATLDSISLSFQADQPSIQVLRSMEIKAKQKLADLADYLQIYNDRSLDTPFRAHAGQMIRDLFISDSVTISLELAFGMNEKSITLHDFFKSGPGATGSDLTFTFDSIVLTEPLHRNTDVMFTGNLGFLQKYIVTSPAGMEIPRSIIKEAGFVAEKVKKPFGSDTLEIWSVFLGNIR